MKQIQNKRGFVSNIGISDLGAAEEGTEREAVLTIYPSIVVDVFL